MTALISKYQISMPRGEILDDISSRPATPPSGYRSQIIFPAIWQEIRMNQKAANNGSKAAAGPQDAPSAPQLPAWPERNRRSGGLRSGPLPGIKEPGRDPVQPLSLHWYACLVLSTNHSSPTATGRFVQSQIQTRPAGRAGSAPGRHLTITALRSAAYAAPSCALYAPRKSA